jgi:hypothetical protein
VTQDKPGAFRRALRRITADDAELDAEELRDDVVEDLRATPVESCGDRQMVTVGGQVRSVTIRPVGGVPALEAELYDGSGTVNLIFLGRRQVGGIEPGRVIVAEGRIRNDDGRHVMFNPKYELRPGVAQ